MYKSVKTERAVRRMVSIIADMKGVYRYRVWQKILVMIYNELDEKQKEYVKKRLKSEGIDIDEFIKNGV